MNVLVWSEIQEISERHSFNRGFNGFMTKYRAEVLKNLFVPSNALLDVGAGEGILTKMLADYFDTVYFVEPSERYIKKAKENLKAYNVKFYNTLFEDFSTEMRFDYILFSGVLEHVFNPVEILKKARNLLKDGGKVVAIVPNAKSLHRQIGVKMGIIKDEYQLTEQDFNVGHKRYYDLEMLKRDFIISKYKIEITGGILLKPFPNTLMENLHPSYVDALYKVGKSYAEMCAEIYLVATKDMNKDQRD